MQIDDHPTTAHGTFFTAVLVVIIGTALIDPPRLFLLCIPSSFLFAAYGLGVMLEQATGAWVPSPPSERPILRLAARLGTGISLCGAATTLLGMIGLYRLTGLLIAVSMSWALLMLVRTVRPWRRPYIPPASFAGGLAMGGVWLIAWLWGTIPPIFYDELAYHLPIAQYALRTGTLPSLPWSYFTFMPHLSDLLLGWGLALGGDVGSRAMHLAFWFGIWVAAWAVVEVVSTPARTPWLGLAMAGAFASSCTFLFLGTLPFAETSLTFAVLASAALIASPTSPAPWLQVGLLWGLAASVKLSGLSWVAAGAVAALVMGWSFRSLLSAGLVTLAMALPWWGRAWWLTGNPLYPLGYQWLGGLYWNDESQARLQGDLPTFADPFSVMALLRLPYDMVMAPERFGSASDIGVLAVGGVCLMLCFPLWSLFSQSDPVQRRQSYAAGLFILITGASWVITSTTTRFYAPALMIGLSVLIALLVRARKAVQAASIVVLIVLGVWGASQFISLHSKVFSSDQVALGRESRTTYAARTLDHYEAARYVRDHLPADATIMFIGESRPYYFDRPSLAPYPFHEHPLTHWIHETGSPEELRDRLKKEGITHVVLNTREFTRLHDSYHVLTFTGPDASLHDQRLKQLPRTMTTLFSKNNVYVFEIPRSLQSTGPKL